MEVVRTMVLKIQHGRRCGEGEYDSNFRLYIWRESTAPPTGLHLRSLRSSRKGEGDCDSYLVVTHVSGHAFVRLISFPPDDTFDLSDRVEWWEFLMSTIAFTYGTLLLFVVFPFCCPLNLMRSRRTTPSISQIESNGG